MGAQAALGRRDATPGLIRETLGYLADRVAGRLREAHLAGRTVTVRVRFLHMRSVTRSVTLSDAISTTLTLTEMAEKLAHSAMFDNEQDREITLLAVRSPTCAPNILCNSSYLSIPCKRLEIPVPDRLSKPPDGEWTGPSTQSAQNFGRAAVGYAAVALSTDERVPGGVPPTGRARNWHRRDVTTRGHAYSPHHKALGTGGGGVRP